MKVAIDVGHASGTGARGNGLEEHEECTGIARHLHQALTARGIESVIIDNPQLGNREDLNEAIREVNAGDYELAVSLHCDCSDNASARGAHVCYVSSAGARCAALIAEPLCRLLPGRAMTTVYRGNLAILTRTRCVAVLCECGFISNVVDAGVIHNEKAKIAECIAAGIQAWSSVNG